MTALVVSMQPLGCPSFGEYQTQTEDAEEHVNNTKANADRSIVTTMVARGTTEIEQFCSRESIEGETMIAEPTEGEPLETHESEGFVLVNRVPSDHCDHQDYAPPSLHDVDVNQLQSSSEEGISPEAWEPISMEDDPPSLPFGALRNLGNTCYLNSALQMLASLDNFTEQIRKHVPIMEHHENETENEGETLRQALLYVLERLAQGETLSPSAFKTKVDERSPLFAGYRQQDAHEFLTTLLDLLDEDYKKKPQSAQDEEMKDGQPDFFDEEDQQMNDATSSPVKKQRLDESQEVSLPHVDLPSPPSSQSFKELEFDDIDNLLHGDGGTPGMSGTRMGKEDGVKCKLIGGRMHATSSALARWDEDTNIPESSDNMKMGTGDGRTQGDSDSVPFSPVDAYFTTQVRVCLTCDSCMYRRTHAETYLHLSLEIGPAIGSIDECLRAFFKPEKREVKCEKCFCETASQSTEITKLPKALLLHLKRFIVDVSPDYSSISYSKDQSAVSLDRRLDLSEQSGTLNEVLAPDVDGLPPKHRYTLRSVVNHIGSSASCGHYTADALRTDHCGQREWIRFNDSFVSRITEEEALDHASTTAYMVLYELESF